MSFEDRRSPEGGGRIYDDPPRPNPRHNDPSVPPYAQGPAFYPRNHQEDIGWCSWWRLWFPWL